jgi:hypothetical protein
MSTSLGTNSKGKDWVDRSKSTMAWAVRKSDGSVVHVFDLKREEKGLACDCFCCACEGDVQAINVGRPADYFKAGTQRMHFRHDSSHQDGKCRLSVAQRVTLRLIASGFIGELPGPVHKHSLKGVSGKDYIGQAVGRPELLNITETVWLDSQAAELHLADGRVVLVKLLATTVIQSERFESVVSVEVDDPEVSNWTLEKIIAQVKHRPNWACWAQHRDDVELAAKAQAEAVEQARQALDLVSEELNQYEGLTQTQRCETALHIHVKDILAEGGIFRTPEYRAFEARESPLPEQNSLMKEAVFLPAMSWALTEVRLERRLGNIVPDVLCVARDVDGLHPPIEMIVEVAVTHKVDEVKRAKIAELGVACIELDAKALSRDGIRKHDALREIAWSHESSKKWIFHPEIVQRHINAKEALARLYQVQWEILQARVALEVAEEERALESERRLKATPDVPLMRAYIADYRQSAHGIPSHIAAGSLTWTLQEMEAELRTRGWSGILTSEMIGPKGLLRHLESLERYEGHSNLAQICWQAKRTLEAVMDNHSLSPWASVVALAVKVFLNEVHSFDEDYRALSDRLRGAIQNGQTKYARDVRFDKLIAALYPRLSAGLAKRGGTQAFAEARTKELQAKQARKLAEIKKEQEALEKAKREREESAAQELQSKQDDLNAAQKAIGDYGTLVWSKHDGVPCKAEAVVARLTPSVIADLPVFGGSPKDLAGSAFRFREQGKSISEWMIGHRPRTAAEVRLLAALLREGGLSTRGI